MHEIFLQHDFLFFKTVVQITVALHLAKAVVGEQRCEAVFILQTEINCGNYANLHANLCTLTRRHLGSQRSQAE